MHLPGFICLAPALALDAVFHVFCYVGIAGGVSVRQGRPDLALVVQELAAKHGSGSGPTARMSGDSGCLFACGPARMTARASELCSTHGFKTVHVETFEF